MMEEVFADRFSDRGSTPLASTICFTGRTPSGSRIWFFPNGFEFVLEVEIATELDA